jgi:hypothetical protein
MGTTGLLGLFFAVVTNCELLEVSKSSTTQSIVYYSESSSNKTPSVLTLPTSRSCIALQQL